jgi:hypothetical protein
MCADLVERQPSGYRYGFEFVDLNPARGGESWRVEIVRGAYAAGALPLAMAEVERETSGCAQVKSQRASMACGMNAQKSQLVFLNQSCSMDRRRLRCTCLWHVGAEGDQVRFEVITAMATKFLVMNFQMQSCAAQLASPAVTSQNLLPQRVVRFGIERQSLGRLGRVALSIGNFRGHLLRKRMSLFAREKLEKALP